MPRRFAGKSPTASAKVAWACPPSSSATSWLRTSSCSVPVVVLSALAISLLSFASQSWMRESGATAQLDDLVFRNRGGQSALAAHAQVAANKWLQVAVEHTIHIA